MGLKLCTNKSQVFGKVIKQYKDQPKILNENYSAAMLITHYHITSDTTKQGPNIKSFRILNFLQILCKRKQDVTFEGYRLLFWCSCK